VCLLPRSAGIRDIRIKRVISVTARGHLLQLKRPRWTRPRPLACSKDRGLRGLQATYPNNLTTIKILKSRLSALLGALLSKDWKHGNRRICSLCSDVDNDVAFRTRAIALVIAPVVLLVLFLFYK
jgi:hypothetical protein